jgi:hypothetical protein
MIEELSEMKRIGVVSMLLVLGLGSEALAQTFSPDAVYLEAFGQGLLYSVNYDHRFTEHVGARVGATYFRWSESGQSPRTVAAVPILGEWLLGSRGRYLEVAAGVLIAHGRLISRLSSVHREGDLVIIVTGAIGLRYQPSDNGLLFRLTAIPFIDRGDALLWPGLSVGYAF